jgi:hypothetical protein
MKSKLLQTSLTFLLVALFAGSALAGENDWLIKAAEKKNEKPPRTIDAAESMSGSGAPNVPQRQSERKKPPRPDYLMGKVIWGESATFTSAKQGKMKVDDWNLVPGDVSSLTDLGGKVGQKYHWSNVNLDKFSYDPEKLPVLFFSGVRSLKLNKSHKNALRQYVLDGGTVVLDSVYGSPHFTKSARKTFSQIFPGRRFRDLPQDHPLLHTYHDLEKINYSGSDSNKPQFEVIHIGARAGVILSPYGMGAGVAGKQHVFNKLKKRGLNPKYMDKKSARQFAQNLVGYSAGYAEVGKIQGKARKLEEPDGDTPSEEFVFAQIRHEGAWNTHPGAANALLKEVRRDSAFEVHENRVVIEPGKDDLSAYPFLFLSGIDTFDFSSSERGAIAKYLKNDGFLVINNALGLSEFNDSALRELKHLKKQLPGSTLEAVSPDHELFSLLAPAGEVRFSPRVRKNNPDLGNKPVLQGLKHNGELVAVYSPYDLEAGWLNVDVPLMRGYEPRSARRLGMNIIAFSMIR